MRKPTLPMTSRGPVTGNAAAGQRPRRPGHHRQRPRYTVDLRVPRVGPDQMRVQAARAVTEATGAVCFNGSVQVMISKRPSSCSASAVQLSTQSPQFM